MHVKKPALGHEKSGEYIFPTLYAVLLGKEPLAQRRARVPMTNSSGEEGMEGVEHSLLLLLWLKQDLIENKVPVLQIPGI